jgi:hypothetical protein
VAFSGATLRDETFPVDDPNRDDDTKDNLGDFPVDNPDLKNDAGKDTLLK